MTKQFFMLLAISAVVAVPISLSGIYIKDFIQISDQLIGRDAISPPVVFVFSENGLIKSGSSKVKYVLVTDENGQEHKTEIDNKLYISILGENSCKCVDCSNCYQAENCNCDNAVKN